MGQALKLRTDFNAAELRKRIRVERDGRVAARLLALASVLDGVSRTVAAAQAGMDRQTLRDWVHRFNTQGLEGLRNLTPGHPVRRLTPEQAAEVRAHVLAGPDPDKDGLVRWRCVDVQNWIAETYQVHYHQSTVGKLLHALKLSHVSVRPMHPESDEATQAAFKKTLPPKLKRQCPPTHKANPLNSGFKTRPVSSSRGRPDPR